MKENKNQEIELEELIWEIILKWRIVIVISCISAVAVCGLYYVKNLKSYNTLLIEQDNVENNRAEIVLTDSERQEVEVVKQMKDLLLQGKEYILNSKLININPYNVETATLNYCMKNSSNIKENHILEVFYKIITREVLTEIISKNSNDSLDGVYAQELFEINAENNILTIKILYDDDNILQNIVNDVKSYIDNAQSQGKIAENEEILLLSEDIQKTVQNDLSLIKEGQLRLIYDMNNKIEAVEKNLNEQQLKELTIQESDNNIISEVNKPVPNKKYALFGGVLGIFVACALIVIKMLFSDKLLSADDITKIYDVKLLGTIKKEKKKKSIFYKIDDFLIGIKDKKARKISLEQQMEFLIDNIQRICQKLKVSCVYLAGSDLKNIGINQVEEVITKLQDIGIQVKFGNDILIDIAALKEMNKIGNVIILEGLNYSKYSMMEETIEKIKEYDVNILGGIVIL